MTTPQSRPDNIFTEEEVMHAPTFHLHFAAFSMPGQPQHDDPAHCSTFQRSGLTELVPDNERVNPLRHWRIPIERHPGSHQTYLFFSKDFSMSGKGAAIYPAERCPYHVE